jgi:hypothetical protein
LSGREFALAAALRLGAFAVALILFTPIVLSLRIVFDCSDTSGACYTGALFMLYWVKPAIYLAFVLSFANILAGRAREAGLPAWIALGVLALLLADLQFGIALGLATGPNLALRGFWGNPVSRTFLPAMAAIGTLCLLRGGAAASQSWRQRLGGLAIYAEVLVAILLAAAARGLIEAAAAYMPGLRGLVGALDGIERPLALVLSLAPLLLAPIALREWRKAGEPGRGGAWVWPVLGAAALIGLASVLAALTVLAGWIGPQGLTGSLRVGSVPVNVLNLAALLAAFALPALLAKLLEVRDGAGTAERA